MLIRPKNGTKITVEKPSAAWRREEVASMSIMGSKLQDDDEVNIGALIIRIRFWGPYNIVIIRNPQNSIGNY